MIYALYHYATDTHMDENGFPGWVDILGGIIDCLIIFAIVLFGLDPHAFGGGYVP